MSSSLAPQTPGILPFHLDHRLRQRVAIPEEAILRQAMIGSHAANEREIVRPINVKRNPDHESESNFFVSRAAAADHVTRYVTQDDRQIFLPFISFMHNTQAYQRKASVEGWR